MNRALFLCPWLVLALSPLRLGAAPEWDGRLRVTEVGMVSPEIVSVTFECGRIVYGDQIPYVKRAGDRVDRKGHQRWVFRGKKWVGSLVGADEKLIYTAARYVGDKLDGKWLDTPGSYALTADGKTVVPTAVHRKTSPSDMGRTGPIHPWQYRCATESTVFLRLPNPLVAGRQYRLSFAGKPLTATVFAADHRRQPSVAVHVSHTGFHPRDSAKVGFLSCWLGSGGPLNYRRGMPFEVVRTDTRRVVFTGKAALSKARTAKDEDAYKSNFNGTDVYELDFSGVQEPGEYVLAVPGVGCSLPFRIDADVWREAFTVSARGFYHQRSGIELGPPYTTFRRPRSFHPDDGVKVYASTCPLMNSGNGINYLGTDKGNFANLVKGKTDEIVPNAWGAYMDAGDWDRRIQHLIVSRYLIELAELFPRTFDGLGLNIPESNDGLPDVVSEALFNLDFYRRMQTADGGIRGGVESSEHPREGEGSWQESLTVMAYAPGVWSSHWYAGVAAQAARFLAPRKPKLAAVYRASARRAMAYAEAHWADLGEIKPGHSGLVDMRNLAAIELFRLTGEKRWHQLFLQTTALRDAKTELYVWKSHRQNDAAWIYARLDSDAVDRAIQSNCRSAILREADSRARTSRKAGFRWTKHDWAPAIGGAFSAPDGISLCRAHALTGDEKYLRAAILVCQTGLGANPLSLCYTTGMGHRSPRHPLHIDSQMTDQPPPPGLTVFGPLATSRGKNEWGQKLASQVLFPKFEEWPTIETYWDIFWYPAMCEFTVQTPMARNAYVWGYLAAAPR
ncbi:MAG: hypothetical protein HN849_34075 [Victivallales bacterium]|nr:hypothetical protein [Victivallales bacterium]